MDTHHCDHDCCFAFGIGLNREPKPGDTEVSCWFKGLGKRAAVGSPCPHHQAFMREAERRASLAEKQATP